MFAHPYAPLGGCADDHVVDVVAGTMLRRGYLVGTFNFRYDFPSFFIFILHVLYVYVLGGLSL